MSNDDLEAIMAGPGGIFEGNVFMDRRGMGTTEDAPATRTIPLTGGAVDGDLAFVLWRLGALPASQVGPGRPSVRMGLNNLSRKGSGWSFTESPTAMEVSPRVFAMLQDMGARIAAMTPAQQQSVMADLDRQRTQQGAPIIPGADKAALLSQGAEGGLLPSSGSTRPKWLPWAIGGGAVVLIGGVAMSMRGKKRVAANRRRRRRRTSR